MNRPVPWWRVVLAAASVAGFGSLAVWPHTPVGVSAQASGDDSAVTVRAPAGSPFAGLEVTVSQTRDMVNQTVDVTWTGGTPTMGEFETDYVQVMQCWGDAPKGPERDQCQFSASAGNTGGGYTGSRIIPVDPVDGRALDPKEPTDGDGRPAAGENGIMYDAGVPRVQFRPVDGEPVAGGPNNNPYYGPLTTNERIARTFTDGTGEIRFEVQTADEAPGLGCGAPDGQEHPRRCWLVIVPRGDTEVDGLPAEGQLDSGPLSASNWRHRLMVRLDFQPLVEPCPAGSALFPTAGSELAAAALASWQPVLCADDGPNFGYLSGSDTDARNQVKSGLADLGFVGRPIPPSETDGLELAYAPLTVSGLGVAFNIDYNPDSFSDPDRGVPIKRLNLTPRLLAKMLSESYTQAGVPGSDHSDVEGNPACPFEDPEFSAANPHLRRIDSCIGPGNRGQLATVRTSIASSDAYWELWRWIAGDPDAAAFLDGDPDEWGMTVNPGWESDVFTLPVDGFPRNDDDCSPPEVDGAPELCTLDNNPYLASMTAAALSASWRDTGGSFWDPNKSPPGWSKHPPQVSGQAMLLTVTDTPSAARYGLPMAGLRNAGGEFVTPTPRSLGAAVAARVATDVDGVTQPDPGADDPSAYPLTSVTYGVVPPDALEDDARTAFGTFLRYVAGDGQESGPVRGQLPEGYLPLPRDLRSEALDIAETLETGSVSTTTTTTSSSTTTTTTTTQPPTTTTTTFTQTTPPQQVSNNLPPPVAPPPPFVTTIPSVTTTTAPAVTTTAVKKQADRPKRPRPIKAAATPPVVAPVSEQAERPRTPSTSSGAARTTVAGVSTAGLFAAAAGPLLRRIGRRSIV